MTLTPGTRLGPYEIVSALGAGGMGQVYRAVDTRLKRHVALKVLPPALATDAERLARFQREAEVLAALNHPHIAQLHGLEDSGSITALVMELVEGEDLAARISAGPIPVDESLAIARQIADALEAAHEQGIVHRDLKPLNIRVRPDGTVKVLDFGLAKALEPSTPVARAALSNSPTLTSPMTAAGIILGTAAYMSPEQARGKSVDKRADIWAFGCVLYEMLTGTALFASESVAETLGLIFSREADLTLLPAATPARVRTLLARCLMKDAKLRLRDIGEARLMLDASFESSVSASTPAPAPQPTAPVARARSPWKVIAAVTAISAIAMAEPALRHLGETPTPAPPETRLEINTPATDSSTSFALSPDGRQVVFAGSGDGAQRLWLRSLSATAARQLDGTEGATYPFWSPDGRSIGFFTPSALKRLDLGGGAPQVLAPVTVGTGGTWNADGTILFAPTNGSTKAPLMRVPAAGGPATAVTTLGPSETGHRSPLFLPDGHRFLFNVVGMPDTAGIYLGSLDGGTPTRLTPADSQGAWLPDATGTGSPSSLQGWLLWVRTGTRTLVAQRLDAVKPALGGDMVTLADSVIIETTAGSQYGAAVSVAGTGLVAYRAGSPSARQLTWLDRHGTAVGTLGNADVSFRNPRVSIDGHRVAVERHSNDNQDIWLMDGLRSSRLTLAPGNDGFPVWSPDGTRLVMESNRGGTLDLFMKNVSGAGAEESLVASSHTKVPFSWSPDGRFVMYSDYDPQTNADIWTVPVDGTRKPSVFLKTRYRESQGMFSPDGRWVAYMSDLSGRNEIYVRPFVPSAAPMATQDGTGEQWQVSTAGGIYPAWRRDGKELYYLDPAGLLMAVPVGGAAGTFQPGVPTPLFAPRIYGGGVDTQQGRNYDVTTDGRFLINMVVQGPTAPITLIQNWNPAAATR